MASSLRTVPPRTGTTNKLGILNVGSPHIGTERNCDRPRFGLAGSQLCVATVTGAREVVGNLDYAEGSGREDASRCTYTLRKNLENIKGGIDRIVTNPEMEQARGE